MNQSIIYLLKIKSEWQEHTHVSSEQDNKAISAPIVALKTYIHIHLHIYTFIHNKLLDILLQAAVTFDGHRIKVNSCAYSTKILALNSD